MNTIAYVSVCGVLTALWGCASAPPIDTERHRGWSPAESPRGDRDLRIRQSQVFPAERLRKED